MSKNSEESKENSSMELEEVNLEEELYSIDLNNIENEIIESSTGYPYYPDKFKKCFIPQSKYAEELMHMTLKIVLMKMKIKNIKEKEKSLKTEDKYIVNGQWYEAFNKYSRINTIKRIIRAYGTYEMNPIKYNPNEKSKPGMINNKDLFIKNKINSNDGRNILISKNNNSFDTKLKYKKDIKCVKKSMYKILKRYFNNDIDIPATKNDIGNKPVFGDFYAHLNLIFLPTLDKYKEVNEQNFEEFQKNNNIIYDIYFKLNTDESELYNEIKNILRERPELLANMGVHFISENSEDELMNHINYLNFYFPKETNNKSPKEMLDFILSKDIIENLKSGKKISSNDIQIQKENYYYLSIDSLFGIDWRKEKNNIDEIKNGVIFIEYLPKEKNEENLNSIFEEVESHTHKSSIMTYSPTGSPKPTPQTYHKEYKLEDYEISKEKNKNGLVGLNNLGNTCYMNTGIQCLSNCELLSKYFLLDYYKEFINKENPIGSQGEIVEKYSQLIQHLWHGNEECVSPIQFKKAFGKVYEAFSGSSQQDSQEFISYLLDSLHEDLNKVKNKPYINEKDIDSNLSDEEIYNIKKNIYLCRNQSFISDLICGFFKSTLFCPEKNCKNIKKSFEPFNMISLSLVNEAELRKIEALQEEQNKKLGIKILTITFIPFKLSLKPLNFKIRIKKDTDVFTFKKKVETLTKFNMNSFEIYKIQGTEYLPMKPDMLMMEEFLRGEKRLILVQIPPYVFGKKNNYFDAVYQKLVSDMDKYFLEEEKYEGNDMDKIYKEYVYTKENKSKTDDDLHLSQNIKKNMDIDDNFSRNKNKSKDMDSLQLKSIGLNKEAKDIEINITDNITNKMGKFNKDKKSPDKMEIEKEEKEKEKEDEKEKEENKNLCLDKSQWVKAEFYNYSYSFKEGKKVQIKEDRISKPKIIYLNKDWNNAQVYDCIIDMLEDTKHNMPEIKDIWMQDLKDITINLDQINKSKAVNVYEQFNELSAHPLMLQYKRFYNYNKENIMTKDDIKKNKNSVFVYDKEKYEIKSILSRAEKKGNSVEDTEILFKIMWKQNYAQDYKEYVSSKNLEKSEKLEEIFKNMREDEYLKKNEVEKSAKNSNDKNKNKKKLNLDELLTNFSQIEKLSNNNEWYCPKCKKLQLADKKMEIYSLSEVLIIHLKRFRNNRKIENLVDFPIEGLDLSKYLPNKKEKYIYDLFGVSNHTGSLNGGHYYAYCKNWKDGEWYEFNDSHVSKIDRKKIVSDNAYVLFYIKKRGENDKINEEELFKKPLIEIDHTKYE